MAKEEKEKIADVEKQAVEQPTENATQQATIKQTFRDRIRASYPDMADSEDEDVYNKFADDKEEEITSMRDNLQVIEDVITADEDARAVITDMVVNKTPFRVAIAKFLSQEDLTSVEGDDDYESYQTAYNERLERGRKNAESMAQIEKNVDEAEETFEAFCKEKGMDEDTSNKFNDFIGEFFNNLLFKKLTTPMLQAFYNAMNHDSDVNNAREEGEIKGRNANIEAIRMKGDDTDGIPNATTSSGGTPKPKGNKFTFLHTRNNI